MMSGFTAAKVLEPIAKLASENKFDDFGFGSIFCQATYPNWYRRLAKNRTKAKSANLGPNGVLQWVR